MMLRLRFNNFCIQLDCSLGISFVELFCSLQHIFKYEYDILIRFLIFLEQLMLIFLMTYSVHFSFLYIFLIFHGYGKNELSFYYFWVYFFLPSKGGEQGRSLSPQQVCLSFCIATEQYLLKKHTQ